MMKKLRLISIFSLSICLTACAEMLGAPVGIKNDYLRDKHGEIVMDCDGSALSGNSLPTRRFWDENNLPHGTTDFVCKGGKAYLPGQVPK